MLANGRAKLSERLARWLLMARERVDGARIRLTREFLATMLVSNTPSRGTKINALLAVVLYAVRVLG